MKQILLTGASEFIGRNIAEGLRDQYIYSIVSVK